MNGLDHINGPDSSQENSELREQFMQTEQPRTVTDTTAAIIGMNESTRIKFEHFLINRQARLRRR